MIDDSRDLKGLILFKNATIKQLRANHRRVPKEVSGWGIATESLEVRTQFWIFAQSSAYGLYWMHTNLIREIEVGVGYVEFETDSNSLYRVEYLEAPKPEWVTPAVELLIESYVNASRELLRSD